MLENLKVYSAMGWPLFPVCHRNKRPFAGSNGFSGGVVVGEGATLAATGPLALGSGGVTFAGQHARLLLPAQGVPGAITGLALTDVIDLAGVPQSGTLLTTIDAAGQATGATLIGRVRAGQFYKPLGGAWTKK